MATSTVTSKGQVTIPKVIRDFMDIQAGDRIHFMRDRHGNVVVKPATKKLSSLKGIVTKPQKAVTLEQMERAIKARSRS